MDRPNLLWFPAKSIDFSGLFCIYLIPSQKYRLFWFVLHLSIVGFPLLVAIQTWTALFLQWLGLQCHSTYKAIWTGASIYLVWRSLDSCKIFRLWQQNESSANFALSNQFKLNRCAAAGRHWSGERSGVALKSGLLWSALAQLHRQMDTAAGPALVMKKPYFQKFFCQSFAHWPRHKDWLGRQSPVLIMSN